LVQDTNRFPRIPAKEKRHEHRNTHKNGGQTNNGKNKAPPFNMANKLKSGDVE
jgi:hypothetical protein